MNEQQSTKPTRFRFLRRILKFVLITSGLIVVVVVLGILGIWGHFWDFRVGDPTSDSCSSCHVMDQYVDTMSDLNMLAGRHSTRDIACIDCHEYGLEEQLQETLAYLREDYNHPFMRAQYGMDTCFECHEHGSYDQIAWRTTDLGITDAQAGGHIANPHQPPHYTELECHSCHRMHRPFTLLCTECHSYQFRFQLTPSTP